VLHLAVYGLGGTPDYPLPTRRSAYQEFVEGQTCGMASSILATATTDQRVIPHAAAMLAAETEGFGHHRRAAEWSNSEKTQWGPGTGSRSLGDGHAPPVKDVR
jgi:hypothetical protein